MGDPNSVVNDKYALNEEEVHYGGDGQYEGFQFYRSPATTDFLPGNEFHKILGFYRGVDRILSKNDKLVLVGMDGDEIGFCVGDKIGINMRKLWKTQKRNDKEDYREFMIQVKGVNYHQLAHRMYGIDNYSDWSRDSNEYYCLEALNDCRDEVIFAETYPRSKEYFNYVYYKQYIKQIDKINNMPAAFQTDDVEKVRDAAFVHLYGRKSYVPHRIIKKYEKRFIKRYGELKTTVVKNIVDKFLVADSGPGHRTLAKKLAAILDMKNNNPMHDLPSDNMRNDNSPDKSETQTLMQVVMQSKQDYDNDEQEKQEKQNKKGGGKGKSDEEQEQDNDQKPEGGGGGGGDGDESQDQPSPQGGSGSQNDQDEQQEDEKDNPSGSGAPIRDDGDSEDEEEKEDEKEDYEDADEEEEDDDEQPDDEQNDDESSLSDLNEQIMDELEKQVEHLKDEVEEDVSKDIKSIKSSPNPFAPPTAIINNAPFRPDEEARMMKRKMADVLKLLTDELSLNIHRKQRTGRLDLRSVMRPKALSGEDAKLFRRKVSDKKDYAKIAMVICLDTSGSMSDGCSHGKDKLTNAKKAAWIISQAMEECDNPVSLIVFRSEAQEVKIVKDFNKKGDWNFDAGGGTEPSHAIKLGVRMLDNIQTKEEIDNLMLIVVTDGEWCDWEAYDNLFRKIEKEYEDIETIQIDVAHAGKSHGAKHYIKLKSFEDLPAKLKEVVINMQKTINRRLM